MKMLKPPTSQPAPHEDWTWRFRKASVSHARRKALVWTLSTFALLAPAGILTRTDAANLPVKAHSNEISTETPSLSPSTSPLPNDSPASSQSATQLQNDSDSAPVAVPAPPLETPQTVETPQDVPQPVETQAPPTKKQPEIRLNVIADGATRHDSVVVTSKMTVGQALAALGIALGTLDRVSPEPTALARDGQTIRIVRVKAELKTKTQAVAPKVRYQPSTALAPGAKKTVQNPQSGVIEITERVWSKDGKVTKREFVSRRLARPAQDRIIALGTKPHLMPGAIAPHRRYARALSARGGSPRDRAGIELKPANPGTFQAVRSLTVTATGYAAGRAGGAIGSHTATGVRCTYGAIAVDPRVIPLGSKLYIEGYGYGFACDTGGAIKGKHIDLAFDSPAAAFRHGRRKMKVWILGP